MWAFINSLQLVLHLPMNNVAFPEATTNVITPLIKVVTFDVTEILDLVGLNVEVFTFTDTNPFSENSDLLGYGSQNTIDNLGIINLVIVIMCLEVIFFLILCVLEKWCKNGRTKRIRENFKPHAMLGRFWRFMLEASLEIMFVSMISLAKSSDKEGEEDSTDDQEEVTESTPGDRFMIVYTIFLLVATFVFICALIWYTMAGFYSLLEVK